MPNEIIDDTELRMVTAALMTLAKHDIPVDVQELLINGDPSRGIKPGALSATIRAVIREARKST